MDSEANDLPKVTPNKRDKRRVKRRDKFLVKDTEKLQQKLNEEKTKVFQNQQNDHFAIAPVPVLLVNSVEGFISNIDFNATGLDLLIYLKETLSVQGGFNKDVIDEAIDRVFLFPPNQLNLSVSKGCGIVVFSKKIYFDCIFELAQNLKLVFRNRQLRLKLSDSNNEKVPREKNLIATKVDFKFSKFFVGSNVLKNKELLLVAQWQSKYGKFIFNSDDRACVSIEVGGNLNISNLDFDILKFDFHFQNFKDIKILRDIQANSVILSFSLRRPPQIWKTNLFLINSIQRSDDPSGCINVFGRCLEYSIHFDIESFPVIQNLKKLSLISNKSIIDNNIFHYQFIENVNSALDNYNSLLECINFKFLLDIF